MIKLGNDWDELLKDEFNQPYYLTLRQFLKKEYQTKKVFPDMYDI
ncbi:uracil-DNA glycosylase, partial [Listeria monocytogenes FSL F2-208]